MTHLPAHVIQYIFCGLLIIISVPDKKFVLESARMSKVRLWILVIQKTKEHTHIFYHCLCSLCSAAKSCPLRCASMDYSPPVFSVQGLPRQECQSGLPFTPPRDFLSPGINSDLLSLLYLQVASLQLWYLRSPYITVSRLNKNLSQNNFSRSPKETFL